MTAAMITLDEGMSRLENAFSKATRMLDGVPPKALFTSEEYMSFYNCAYHMCVQHVPFDYSRELYERITEALKASIHSRILPALADKNGAPLLTELLCMWERYKVMAKCLGGLFLYLDRHFADHSKESIKDLSHRCFRDLVFCGYCQKFQDAAISLINQERDEKSIDKNLLKNFSTFLVEIEEKGNTCSYDSFEKAILENTASYCHNLASQWLLCCSSTEYFHKANWYLIQEKERACQYLFETSVKKLLQVVRWQLLNQTQSMLTEKQKAEGNPGLIMYQELLSGCASLSLGDGSYMS